jgi:hypothetical protein
MVGGLLELEMERAVLRENRVSFLTYCGRIVACIHCHERLLQLYLFVIYVKSQGRPRTYSSTLQLPHGVSGTLGLHRIGFTDSLFDKGMKLRL